MSDDSRCGTREAKRVRHGIREVRATEKYAPREILWRDKTENSQNPSKESIHMRIV